MKLLLSHKNQQFQSISTLFQASAHFYFDVSELKQFYKICTEKCLHIFSKIGLNYEDVLLEIRALKNSFDYRALIQKIEFVLQIMELPFCDVLLFDCLFINGYRFSLLITSCQYFNLIIETDSIVCFAFQAYFCFLWIIFLWFLHFKFVFFCFSQAFWNAHSSQHRIGRSLNQSKSRPNFDQSQEPTNDGAGNLSSN